MLDLTRLQALKSVEFSEPQASKTSTALQMALLAHALKTTRPDIAFDFHSQIDFDIDSDPDHSHVDD